jgi:F0F1-type ATP synthase membrane subunit b/b'
VGNKTNDWGYVIIIVCLAFLFVLILPIIGFMYMDVRQQQLMIASDIRKIEKLKKELEKQKETSKE